MEGRVARVACVEESVEDDQRLTRDGGFSVIEIVITIALMAIAILPLMDATLTSVRASSTAREAAEIETVLANAADRVNRAGTRCDYAIFAEAAAQSKGWQASTVTLAYQHYVPGPSARAEDAGVWASGACPIVNGSPTRTPRLIQLVTVSITSPSGDVSRSVKVVKSDV